MKIKKSRLMQIIQEEISRLNEEDRYSDLNLDALAMAAKKDPDAIDALLGRLIEKHHNFALRIAGGHRQDAEDALQIAATKVFQKLDSFKGDSSFSTWAGKIIKNTIIDIFRKNKETPRSGVSSGRPGEASIVDISDASQGDDSWSVQDYDLMGGSRFPDPEKQTIDRDFLEKVVEKIKDENLKNYFKLRFIDELSQTEAAAELGFSQPTASRYEGRIRDIINIFNKVNVPNKGGINLEETIKATIMEMLKEADYYDYYDDDLEEETPEGKFSDLAGVRTRTADELEASGELPKGYDEDLPNPVIPKDSIKPEPSRWDPENKELWARRRALGKMRPGSRWTYGSYDEADFDPNF